MIDNGLASIVCLISKFIYTFMSFYEHEGSKTNWSTHATLNVILVLGILFQLFSFLTAIWAKPV